MKRRTTPTHEFVIPFNTSIINRLRITYSQNDTIVLTKELEDCELGDKIITTVLSVQDTARFSSKDLCDIQLEVYTSNDESLQSDIFTVSVDKCLNNGVF